MYIVGILGSSDEGCLSYGKSLERYCDTLGIEFDVFNVIGESFEATKAFIAEMNSRNDVDGMIVFTPIFGGELVSLLSFSVYNILSSPTTRPPIGSRDREADE